MNSRNATGPIGRRFHGRFGTTWRVAVAALFLAVAEFAQPSARTPQPPGGAGFSSEYDLLRRLPPALRSQLGPGRPDAQGFIGFHQQSQQWIEAGMQRGGCWMLIDAVVAGDESRAEDAWRSIDTTFARQVEDGGFASNQKPGVTHAPTRPERVETAFFYLQELGHALLVVRASPMEGRFHDRVEQLKPRIRRACAFIQSGYDGIITKAGHTANRMLIAAKAFGLCGVLLEDDSLKEGARKLIEVALARRDADGVFIENGGRDSSYNAVCLLMGQVLALHLPHRELEAAMVKTMAWQRTRILPTGEVDVGGNTRTGVGKEAFLGKPKGVNYGEVVKTFALFGMIHNDPSALAIAERVLHRGPTYESLAHGLQRVQLLTGQRGFVFTLYGAPADLAAMRDLVEVMKAQRSATDLIPAPRRVRPRARSSISSLPWAGRSCVIRAAICRSLAGGARWGATTKRRCQRWMRRECSLRCNLASGAITSTTWHRRSPGGAKISERSSMPTNT